MIEALVVAFVKKYVENVPIRPLRADNTDSLPVFIYSVSGAMRIETLDEQEAVQYSGVLELWTKTLADVAYVQVLPASDVVTIELEGGKRLNAEFFLDPYITEEGEFAEAFDEIAYRIRVPFETLVSYV